MSSNGYISPNVLPPSGGQENPVALPSGKQRELEDLRALPRALMGGTPTMREAGRTYAPQHPAESDEGYAVRIGTTVLYGAFSQTVTRQAGKLFEKPITIVDGDDVIQTFVLDVDGEGRSLTSFMNDAVKDGFVDGIAYLMVEFPVIPEGATQADVLLMRARPYWVLIRACQVLGWKSMNVGGNQVLTQFRFMELVEEPIDEFSTECIEQIRVLDVGGFFRTYRKKKDSTGKEDWMIDKEGRASWFDIPVIPIYINRTGFFEAKPPLRELAELNQEHWASSSEQRRALSFLRFAMLAVIGANNSKTATPIEIGPDKILNLPVGGDAHYVEHNGQGIRAGLEDLDAIEKRMQSTGMELRIENAGQVTATASAIDSTESNAALKAVAKGVEAAVNQALAISGEFLRVANTGTAKVYDEFAEEAEGSTNEFVALYGSGLVSRETVWDELVRRHVLDEDFDPALEAERLAQEAERMAALQGAPLELGGSSNQTEGATSGME